MKAVVRNVIIPESFCRNHGSKRAHVVGAHDGISTNSGERVPSKRRWDRRYTVQGRETMDLGGYIFCAFLGILSVPATRLRWDSAVSKTVGLRPAWNFCAGKADSSNSVW